jgi:hypothetical protein
MVNSGGIDMTVAELMEKLGELDPSLRVFTRGNKGGYEDPYLGDVREFALDVNTLWSVYGPHEESQFCKDMGVFESAMGVTLD